MKAFSRILAIAALWAVPAIGHAQLGDAPLPQISPSDTEKPSLEATLKWITDKYREIGLWKSGSENYGFTYSRSEVTFLGCKYAYIYMGRVPAGGVARR